MRISLSYLFTVFTRISIATLPLGLGLSLLSGVPTAAISAIFAALAATAGIVIGPLYDPYLQKLPDGTIDLSVLGNALMTSFPLVAGLLVGLGGVVGFAMTFLFCICSLIFSVVTIVRRALPL